MVNDSKEMHKSSKQKTQSLKCGVMGIKQTSCRVAFSRGLSTAALNNVLPDRWVIWRFRNQRSVMDEVHNTKFTPQNKLL